MQLFAISAIMRHTENSSIKSKKTNKQMFFWKEYKTKPEKSDHPTNLNWIYWKGYRNEMIHLAFVVSFCTENKWILSTPEHYNIQHNAAYLIEYVEWFRM